MNGSMLDQVLKILEFFRATGDPFRLTELAERANRTKTTAHRLTVDQVRFGSPCGLPRSGFPAHRTDRPPTRRLGARCVTVIIRNESRMRMARSCNAPMRQGSSE